MRYRLLGNSGLRVSEAALGTMTFGEDWGWGAQGRGKERYTMPSAGLGVISSTQHLHERDERIVPR